jgi:hypothetical protein
VSALVPSGTRPTVHSSMTCHPCRPVREGGRGFAAASCKTTRATVRTMLPLWWRGVQGYLHHLRTPRQGFTHVAFSAGYSSRSPDALIMCSLI